MKIVDEPKPFAEAQPPSDGVQPEFVGAQPLPAHRIPPSEPPTYPVSERIIVYVALTALLAWLGGMIRDQTFFLGEPHYFISLPFALLAFYVACTTVGKCSPFALKLHGFIALICLGFVGTMRLRAADWSTVPVVSEWLYYPLAVLAVGAVAVPVLALVAGLAREKHLRELGCMLLLTVGLLVLIAIFAPCM